MDNTSTLSNICNFDSIECNGRIKPITYNTKIPKSTESIISVGIINFVMQIIVYYQIV